MKLVTASVFLAIALPILASAAPCCGESGALQETQFDFKDSEVPYFVSEQKGGPISVRIVRRSRAEKPTVIDSQEKESSILHR